MKTGFVLFILPALASSFVAIPSKSGGLRTTLCSQYATDDDQIYEDYADKWLKQRQQEKQQQQPHQQEQEQKSPENPNGEPKIPTFEMDYLAAARKRAAERPKSINSQAGDDDWKKVSEEKMKEYGIKNAGDWEEWAKAAGDEDEDDEFGF